MLSTGNLCRYVTIALSKESGTNRYAMSACYRHDEETPQKYWSFVRVTQWSPLDSFLSQRVAMLKFDVTIFESDISPFGRLFLKCQFDYLSAWTQYWDENIVIPAYSKKHINEHFVNYWKTSIADVAMNLILRTYNLFTPDFKFETYLEIVKMVALGMHCQNSEQTQIF